MENLQLLTFCTICTYDGEEESITIYFDVIDTGESNHFILGDDALQCFSYDFESILLEEEEFKIYARDY